MNNIKQQNILNNKKGQYYGAPEPRQPYSNVSPILIAGIMIVVLKFLLPIMGVKEGIEWIFWVGLFVIIIGGFHSVMKSM